MKYIYLVINLFFLFLQIYLIKIDFYFLNLPFYVLFIFYLYLLHTCLPSVFPFLNKKLIQGRHFNKNYINTDYEIEHESIVKDNKKAILSLLLWLIGLIIVGVLYYTFDFFTPNFIFLGFAIILNCEWICLYVFCFFKKIIKTGSCCATCRIKNYDNFYRFSLFIFIPSFFTYSLFLLGLFSLIQWEYLYKKHPKRFYNKTNRNINCKYCKNKNINCIKKCE